MQKKKLVLLIALCTLIYISAPFFVFSADDVTTLQNKISEKKSLITNLQEQIAAIQKALASKQTEKSSLQNQLSIINARLQKAKLDLKATQTQLEATQLALSDTQKKITDKEKTIASEQIQISELVRSLDGIERQTLVSVLASGKTLSDVFSAQDAYESVDTDLTAALVRVMRDKQELSAIKAQYEAQKQALEATKQQLIVKNDQLQSQTVSKSQLLAETQSSEQKFQKIQADLKRQYAATENEISAIERQIQQKLKNNAIKLPTGSVSLRWPTPSHSVTAGYHDPDYPFRNVFEHPGIDIRSSQGSAIVAAGPGIVARAKNAGMGYSYVIIVHNNKISTVYGHLSRILVREDQAVAGGEVIGMSGGMPGTPGAGPFVTGPHLHFEVRSEGIPVNPLEYLP